MNVLAGTLHLKPDRDKPLRQRHPWVFSGAIQRIEGNLQMGDLVNIVAANGSWLASAYFNPHSQIQGRVLSWDAKEVINPDFWRRKLHQAVKRRAVLQLEPQTTAYRLVNAEADQLPGLIIDKYGEFLVLQSLTAGIDQSKTVIVEQLKEVVECAGILERSDAPVRKKEGIPLQTGLLWGNKPPQTLTVHENGHAFMVDLAQGHKTGLYLDQRDNRALVCQPRFVAGKNILNVFSYTGGFAIYAAANAAKTIVNIDSSMEALQLAEKNIELNGYLRPNDEYWAADAFELLRHYRDNERKFDMVILDPPKFAHHQSDIERACRGYKDLNLLAMRILQSGGLLATFSCSGLISADLFQKVLFGAAIDAHVHAQILYHLHQAPDHPTSLTFPESAYLKGFLCLIEPQ